MPMTTRLMVRLDPACKLGQIFRRCRILRWRWLSRMATECEVAGAVGAPRLRVSGMRPGESR